MKMSIPGRTRSPIDIPSLLGLAAAPVFVLMACISALAASGMSVCTAASAFLPIDGMALMYLLMGLFHISPWLKLLSPQTEGE